LILSGRQVLALVVLALAPLGCLARGRFHCDDDRQCTRAGQRGFCEAGQICSFEDVSCELGRRYGSYADEAGRLAGRCVEPVACQGTPVVEVRAGGEHACYRRLDGRVACWGRNDTGQLGDGTTMSRSTPVQVVGLPGPVRALALGRGFTCAIDNQTQIACWGADESGQLGSRDPDLAIAGSVRPIAVPGVQGALELAAGGAFACARGVDGVLCWGANDEGQLGRGDRDPNPAISVVILPAPADQIVTGQAHACARLRDGTVACWGDGRRGQLGGGDLISQPRAVRVAGLEGVVEIAAGGMHTCARLRDGTLSCWGDDSAGQVGGTTMAPVLIPTPVTALPAVSQVRAGARHTCVVLSDETVICFGAAGQGRTGSVTSMQVPAPGAVVGVNQVLDLAVGGEFSCALERDATVRCWGADGHGQLGAGGAIWRARPSPLPVVEGATAVAARDRTTCVARAGEVSCFGAGAEGALGNGQTDDQSTPSVVRIPAGVVDVATGAAGGCARTLDRQVWCWGRGVGITPVLRSGVTAADEITAGRAHACALSRGRVLCWGENRDGQLGQPIQPGGMTNTLAEPATVPLPAVIVEVAAADDHTCARSEAGQIFCWGRGDEGQLGDGRLQSSPAPLAVALPEPARAISGGAAHTCALLISGQVWCWGRNRDGQQGEGQGPVIAAPTVLPGVAAAEAIAAGGRFTCTIQLGQLICLGAGAIAPVPAVPAGPQTIAQGVAAIAAGAEHGCSIDLAGALRCFGLDASGQLGTGRPLFSARPRPVAVACP
jgi:alpha-tubulin suppressor-like RCC1 family protein